MAVIHAYPAAGAALARGAARNVARTPPEHAAVPPRRARSLLLLGLVPLLLATASWDAVTFLGGTGAHALPAAHSRASACA